MKKQRRLLALLLALVLALSSFAAIAEEEKTYPTQWDLTEVYPDLDAWNADYEKVMELLPQHENYRGTLNTAQGIYDYIQFAYLGELTQMQCRLSLYADLGYNLNPADPTFTTLFAKLNVMSSQEAQYIAFVEPEIFSLPLETRQELLSDPLLAPYAYWMRSYVDPDHQPFSEETNTALAILSPAIGRAESIYNILRDVDLPDPIITMPDGTEAELSEELYTRIVYSNDYDREFKALANQTLLTKPLSFVNTFTALLEDAVRTNWASAQLNNYATSREAALAASDVDPAIYDMVIEAAHEGAPDYQRYLSAHKRGLGLEEQYPFDLPTYVSDFEAAETPYEEAVDEVRAALSVLGEDYIAHYDALVNSSHLDVYPTDTKISGAFSTQVGEEYLPYMLFNYVGYSSDVSTLAHEMGHAIYSRYSSENQIGLYSEPTIFTHEVASTTNELLYYTYKMNNAATEDERLFYLENVLSMFAGTFFVQALYAEFEDAAYQTVEAGDSLDGEALSDLWTELYATYRGDTIKTYPDGRYQWTQVPHFYYNYYVYQYATAVAYADSICQRITSGEEGAVEDYLAFLKLGSSAAPAELLATADVDPLNAETYQRALDFFGGMVDEYEQICDARAE